jgi:hypothetical protein
MTDHLSKDQKLTIDELAKLLDRENDWDDNTIEILPNGEVRAKKGDGTPKVLTMKENLGGEYAS